MFDRRGSFRTRVCTPAKLFSDAGETEQDCLIVNVSEEGAAVELELLDTPSPSMHAQQITLKLVTGEVMTGTRKWGDGIRIGLKLSGPTKMRET